MPLPPRIPKTGLPPKKSKPARKGMSRDHLTFVRKLECPIYPGERPIEAHHLLRADQTRGLGRRAADKYAIPLSRKAHQELHANGDEEVWLANLGVDGRTLAAALWRISGNIEAGLRIVNRALAVRRHDKWQTQLATRSTLRVADANNHKSTQEK